MCSKRIRATLAFLLGTLSIGLGGCGLRVGESPVSSSSPDLGKETACLAGGMQITLDFIHGKATDGQLKGVWDCAERSIQMFVEKTRGQKAGVYSARELRNFLENYFLNEDLARKKVTVSDRMLREIMEVKRTLLGGASEVLTREELRQVGALMRVMKEATLTLLPYMPLSFEAYAERSEQDLHEALDALERAALMVSKALQKSGYDYQFSHLIALAEEFERLPGLSTDTARSIREFRETLPVAQQLKSLLISPNPDRVSGSDWDTLVIQASLWYGALLRFKHARKKYDSLTHGRGRDTSIRLARDLILLLDDSVSRRHDQIVTFDELDALVSRLDPAVLTFMTAQGPRFLTPASTKAAIRLVIRKGLGGQHGVDRAVLARASEHLEDWVIGQTFLDRLWEAAGKSEGQELTPSQPLTRKEILKLSVHDVFGSAAEHLPARSRKVVEMIRERVRTAPPLYYRNDNEITLAPMDPFANPEHSYASLTKLNTFHLLGRLLIQSYGSRREPEPAVSMSDMEAFYYDIRGIGIELKLFDPANMNLNKRFVEGDLFTFDSNGDRYLTAQEVASMLAFIVSTKEQSSRFHNAIATVCNTNSTGSRDREVRLVTDFFDYEMIDPVCYRREFFGAFEQLIKRMPGMVTYYKSLSALGIEDERLSGCNRFFEKSKERFECELENAARNDGVTSQRFDSSDSEGMYGLSQYIEAIFLRYDVNADGVIDNDEAIEGDRSAFQTFRYHLSDATCKIGTCVTGSTPLKAIFTFMLAHGRAPTAVEAAGWILIRPTWGLFVKADRTRLAEILGNLSRAISKKPL